LGPAIERRKQQLGLCWQEVAARASVSRTTLRLLVRGQVEPRLTTVQAIAEALDTTPCNLLRGDGAALAASASRDPVVDQVCEAIGRLPPNRLMAVAQIVDAIADASPDAPASGALAAYGAATGRGTD
jgi:transcriptional regulator with XRE-family HTH domain